MFNINPIFGIFELQISLVEGYYVVCMPSDANGSSKDFLVNSNGLSFYRGLRPAADI